jgi:amino acid transporter
MNSPSLARKISLPLLTFYGLGTILGAGIYVLIGEVALRAGKHAPFSFIFAALIAAITAYSFARLSSLFPKSAGPAAYTQAAFHHNCLSIMTGLSVIAVGSISAATMIKGFAGYFSAIVTMPEILAVSSVIISLFLISAWGISQSVALAALITVIEIGGLLFIILIAIDTNQVVDFALLFNEDLSSYTSPVLYAAFICFYAYIGFEDIVNIAEETINPSKVMPMAIGLCLLFSTLLYVGLSVACSLYIPDHIYTQSSAPLVSIVEYRNYNTTWMAVVSMIAILNGALVQFIMASRVLYGMSSQGLIPALFTKINPITNTPVIATAAVACIVFILATALALIQLAEITSMITLIIFIIVQASLLYLTFKHKHKRKLDVVLPILGIVMNIILIYFGLFLR